MGRISSEYWDQFNSNDNNQKNTVGCFAVVVFCIVLGLAISNAMNHGQVIPDKKTELYKNTIDSLHNKLTDTTEIKTR